MVALKLDHQYQQQQQQLLLLIPGLRCSLALHCLARVPRKHYHSMIQVSKSWRHMLVSKELYLLRRELGIDEPWIFASFCRKDTEQDSCLSNWLEAYDPRFNIWHRLGPLPGIPHMHILKGFGFVAIDEKLYVVGGRLGIKAGDDSHCTELDVEVRKDVYEFNCITGKWRQCASMQTPRVDFACAAYNGSIYVAGGRTQTGQEKGVCSAEMYIPEMDCWVPLPNMSTGRFKCVGVICESKIHIVGGFAGPEDSEMINPFTTDRSSVDVYDPARGNWEVIKGMWQLDIPPNQIVSVKGRLYSSGDALTTWKGRIEVYDRLLNMWNIVEGSWLSMTQLGGESERCYLTMAAIKDRLYFLGGYRLLSDPSKGLETIHIFHTSTNDAAHWKELEPIEDLTKDLCSHCCVVAL